MTSTPVYDGATSFMGGQDASKVPDKVPPDSFFAGINITTANGILAPRWGYEKLTIQLPEGGLTLSGNRLRFYSDIFRNGIFQAFIPYSIGNNFYLVVIVSGVIFLIDQSTFIATVLDIKGGSRLNELSPRINWTPAGKFIVIFDYPDFPVILDGVEARRADPAKFEVPVSVLGTYNQNRLFIVNAGNEFTGGDPTGNPTTPEAPLTFTEVETPGPFFGQVFQLGTNYSNDPITAVAFLEVVDTSTGIGPLLIATQNAIWAYNTQNPRESWQPTSGNTTFSQFGSLFIDSSGIAGPRSFVNVNSDIFFLSGDGQLRSASMSRDEQKKWSKVPMSREVQNWLKYWDRSLIPFGTMNYFRNKIFTTANPYRVPARNLQGGLAVDIAYGGFVVMELDNISSLTADSPPVWAGLWTGVRPMDTCVNNDRMFIISKDSEFRNEIYEVDPSTSVDIVNDKLRYVRSRVYTRNYDFQDGFKNKEINTIDISLRNVQGDFELDLKYKPSHGTKFLDWKIFKHIAPWRTCKIPTNEEVNGFAPQSFRDLFLGSPIINQCNPLTKDFYDIFRKMQLQFTMTGKYWEIHEYRMKATVRPLNETEAVCFESEPVEIFKECNDDWAIPQETLCQVPIS